MRNTPPNLAPTTAPGTARSDAVQVVHLMPLLLNRSQLGEVLGGLSPRKIGALKSAGRLPPAIKIGRNVRWRLSDVQRWVDQLT